jgi:NitT/TauT family transport system substrate-binding protein
MMNHDSIIDGKKIEITVMKEPQQVQALMMQGKLDFAILPTLMAANLYNKGVTYQMLACPVWGTLYILSNDTIHTMQGLKGRTITVLGQGATPDVLLRRVLDENGITDAKLDYTFTTHAEIAQALMMHKTSVAVVSEPMVSNLISKDPTIHIVAKLTCEDKLNQTDRDLFVQTAFLVSERFSGKNKELVKKIGDAYAASCLYCNEQPENTAKLMLKYKLSTDLAVARRSIPLCNIRYVDAASINDKVYRFLDIFYQFNPKCLGDKIPDKGFVYR